MKAMLVNRVGDCGLFFAIVLLINQYGCVNYDELYSALVFEQVSAEWLLLVCALLFIGVMAKSAQMGLHT